MPSVDSSSSGKPPSALQLSYRIDGDVVEVQPSFYFGEFDHNKTPQSLEGLRKEDLPVRSGGLNDSITIGELSRFGFRPLTIRIVSAKAESPGHMLVESRAPSIQVSIVSEDRGGFQLAYKNISARGCTAFSMTDEPHPPGSGGGSSTGNWWGAVIGPGATIQRPYSVDANRTSIVLLAALFDDGSFEGDPDEAARLTAMREGYWFQHRRIIELTNPIVADPNLDDATKISRIREAVSKLSESPDTEVLDAIRRQFPNVSAKTETDIGHIVSGAMRNEKQSMDRFFDEYKRLQAQSLPQPPSLARLWKIWSKQ